MLEPSLQAVQKISPDTKGIGAKKQQPLRQGNRAAEKMPDSVAIVIYIIKISLCQAQPRPT